MPLTGILCGGHFERLSPLNSMSPLLRWIKPMMLRSVVVLPTPLRPSRAAHSPSFTSRSTPCRMCSLPMWTCTLRRLSIERLLDVVLVLGAAEIGFAHAFVSRDLFGRTRCKNRPLRHDGDRVGNIEHDGRV